jgi:hypothetical protein
MTSLGPKPPYSPSILKQLYTWFIFAVVFLLAWDSALTSAITRLNGDTDTAFQASSPRVLRRPYLMALSLYSIVIAWFNIAFFMLIAYSACSLLWMTAPMCKVLWEQLVRIVFVPDVVFNCMDTGHAPFHAAAALGTLFAAAIAIGFYVTDDDLLKEQHMHSKVVRALFIAPGAMAVAYALYMLFCIIAVASKPPKAR